MLCRVYIRSLRQHRPTLNRARERGSVVAREGNPHEGTQWFSETLIPGAVGFYSGRNLAIESFHCVLLVLPLLVASNTILTKQFCMTADDDDDDDYGNDDDNDDDVGDVCKRESRGDNDDHDDGDGDHDHDDDGS